MQKRHDRTYPNYTLWKWRKNLIIGTPYRVKFANNFTPDEYRKCRHHHLPGVTPGVYGLEAGKGISRANIYFGQSRSSWVLIDATLANCGQLIRRTAESLFGANTRPASILLTHNHPDHAGSAVELAHMWDCPVFVHPDEMPYVAIEDLSTIEKYANPLDRWIILPILRMMPRQRVVAMLSSSSIKNLRGHLTQALLLQDFQTGSAYPRRATSRAMLLSYKPVTVS